MDTSGAMESRDNKELMETTGVTTSGPTVAAEGPLGEGDKVNGDEHEKSRMVNTARDAARIATAITRGRRDKTVCIIRATIGQDKNTPHLRRAVSTS